MLGDYYPPVGFHFSVKISDLEESSFDNLFQSVSGLSTEIEVEEYAEGGQLTYKHKLPVRAKYSNLTLKRGMVLNSELISWLNESVIDMAVSPKDLTITLLNELHLPLVTWNVVNAYPIKWQVEEFNANESKLVVETVELVYSYYTILTKGINTISI